MSLVEKINDDLKNAMKSKDKDTLSVVRMLKSAVKLSEIDLKHELSDDEVISVVSKQIKMRKDSVEEFIKAKREDLANQYQKEIEILNKYMPEQLSLEEVNKIIDDVINDIKPESVKQMGMVIKNVSPKIKGRYDMGEVSKIVKDKLSNI